MWVYTRVLSLTRNLEEELNPQVSSMVLNLRQGYVPVLCRDLGVCSLDTIPRGVSYFELARVMPTTPIPASVDLTRSS